MSDKDKSFVIRITVCTLALIIVGVVTVLLAGLFDSNVDNDKIFAVLAPSFQTIIGCFVGLLAGLVVSKLKGVPNGTDEA